MEVLEFRLHPKGINVIQKYIATNATALQRWPACIYSFVTNASSRKRLRDEYKTGAHAEVIFETLEEWIIGEQNSNATFGELIQILRDQELNYLCDMLIENLETIKNAQLTCKIVTRSGNIQNFWFGMTDLPNFVGRVEDLETLHKLVTENRVEEHPSVALLTSVHGFGGIGKTTLARMYAWKYGNYFDGNVIWIDAEKFGLMRTAFQKVAGKLNLETVKKTNLDLKDLTECVYNAFADSNCLFIFDNAENFDGQDGVEQFLPSGIIRKPYLLLTSRRTDCFPTKRILPLDVLSQSDSIQLIKEYIPGATNKVADELAMRLERVPLAIQQAIAYIKKSIPRYSLSSEKDVSKAMNSFLEEYESNSNRIVKSEFIGRDGYAKNIYSICAMSLKKMKPEEGGKFAKHMLRYISFLDPDDIQLEILRNLDYQFESIWDKFQRIIPWGAVKVDPRRTVDLLCSYSLINVNITEMTIKVHRLVQDAIRLMLEQEEELLYVERLIPCLNMLGYGERLSHFVSIQRSCRFEASKSHVKVKIPQSIDLLQPVFSLGLNNDLSKRLVGIISKRWLISPVTPILERMKCDNINISVEIYLVVYKKIESVLGKTANSLLTNYIVFANFIVSDSHKNIFQSVVECISILRLRRFKRAFLLNLLGDSLTSKDVHIFLDIVNQSGIEDMFSGLVDLDNDLFYYSLFDPTFQIPASLLTEFPCLNYLNLSSSFTNIDELEALNLSWNWRNSGIWHLLNIMEFNLEVVRSAIAYIYYTGCTVAEYIQQYQTILEAEPENKQPEIIVQIINANYFIRVSSELNNMVALICCLRSEFDKQKIKYILTVNYSSFSSFHFWELEDFGIVTRAGKDIYFMKSYIQVALRRKVLSLKSKTWAVKALHKACVKSRSWSVQVDFDDLVKHWRHLMEQEDLKQIATNANLSLD